MDDSMKREMSSNSDPASYTKPYRRKFKHTTVTRGAEDEDTALV